MPIKCSKCDGEFIDGKALEQHTKAKHAQPDQLSAASPQVLKRMEKKEEKKIEKAQELKSRKQGKFLKYGLFLLIIIGISYWMTSASSPSGQTVYKVVDSQGQANPTLNTQNPGQIPTGPIHWHPHLTIIINEQEQVIPAEIGLQQTPHSPVHTHETDGIIHLENSRPTAENMKLKFFFDVWNKKFNKECIFEFCNSGDKKVKFTVNGKENTDFENYIMADGDKMVIEYG